MKYIKYFNENNSFAAFCNEFKIRNWDISRDGLLNVSTTVYLANYDLKKIPVPFGKINGNFNIYSNKLVSLHNSPIEVEFSFGAFNNDLESLNYSPLYCDKYVVGTNDFKSLKGVNDVKTSFNVRYNSNLFDISDLPESELYYFDDTPYEYLFNFIVDRQGLNYFLDLKVVVGNNLYLDRLKEFSDEDYDLDKLNKFWNVV